MLETVNKFRIKGKIDGIKANEAGKVSFFINSYINKRDVNILCNAPSISNEIQDGDTVIVEGYITVTPLEFRKPGQKYRQRFVAASIEKSKSEMEEFFGTEGKHQSADYFVAAFRGIVAGAVKTNENWAKITVMVDNDRIDRYPSRIALDYQLKGNRYVHLPPFDFKSGDRIQAVCSVTTSAKEYDGQNMHFQNLKIEDIQRIFAQKNTEA